MLDLEQIRRRLAAATQGPWHCVDEDGYWYIYGPNDFQIHNSFNSNDPALAEGNRNLIGHAPADIAALIAEVEQLRKEIARTHAMLDKIDSLEPALTLPDKVAWLVGTHFASEQTTRELMRELRDVH